MLTKLLGLLVLWLLVGAGCNNLNSNQVIPDETITIEATQEESRTDADNEVDENDDSDAEDDEAMSDDNETTPDAEDGAVKSLTVTGENFSFSPSTITVNQGDVVRITLKNASGFHDFTLDEFNVATAQIQGGTEETVEFVASKAGEFEYYCSVGQHRQMGMVGTLTVNE